MNASKLRRTWDARLPRSSRFLSTFMKPQRRGLIEGLRDEIASNPDRKPDFGEALIHPTAGATVVGARKPLIAYNINLNTPDIAIAKQIAKRIRFSSGGFPCVKAMGVPLQERNQAQV